MTSGIIKKSFCWINCHEKIGKVGDMPNGAVAVYKTSGSLSVPAPSKRGSMSVQDLRRDYNYRSKPKADNHCAGSLKTKGKADADTRLLSLPLATVYDMFFECGTVLGGYLNKALVSAIDAGDEAKAAQLRSEKLELNRARKSVSPDDRSSMIKLMRKWGTRREELSDALRG